MKSFWLIGGIAVLGGVIAISAARGRSYSCTACKLKPDLTEADLRKIAESNKIAEPDFVKESIDSGK